MVEIWLSVGLSSVSGPAMAGRGVACLSPLFSCCDPLGLAGRVLFLDLASSSDLIGSRPGLEAENACSRQDEVGKGGQKARDEGSCDVEQRARRGCCAWSANLRWRGCQGSRVLASQPGLPQISGTRAGQVTNFGLFRSGCHWLARPAVPSCTRPTSRPCLEPTWNCRSLVGR